MASESRCPAHGPQEVLGAVLAAAPAPVFLMDAQGRHVDVLGAPADCMDQAQALKGKLLHEILDAQAADSFVEQITKALDTGQVTTCVYCLTAPEEDGGACGHGLAGTCWFEARIAPIKGNQDPGQGSLVACACMDITELTKSLLLQEEQRLRLEEQSRLDELTGINNRRQLLDLADLEVERARRYAPKPLSLLRLDVDGLKAINKRFGQEAGDMVLSTLGQALAGSCRTNDIVGRLDGGEFAVLLPETGIEGARLVGDKIRRLAADFNIMADGRHVAVELSVGVSALRLGEDQAAPLFSRADKALSRAKASGKNKVCVFTTGHEATASYGA